MPTKIYLRRGTDSELQAVVLESGEPGWTTDLKRLYIGDGTTSGGIFVGGLGTGVDTVNALYGDVTISGGAGIIITVSGQTILIEETAGGLDVDSLNALTGIVNLVGGSGIVITVSGQSIVIDEETGGADVDSLNGLIGVVTISGVGTVTISEDGQKIVVSGQDVLDVDSINGLTGVVTVSGAGLVTVTQVGQNIVVSGEDPADVSSLNGLVDAVTISGAGTVHVSEDGQVIVVSGQDNELFIPATGGSEVFISAARVGYKINADLENAITMLRIPHDLVQIVSAELVWQALNSVSGMEININTTFAAAGEESTTHQDATTIVQTTTAGYYYESDVSDALTLLSANDVLGVEAYRPISGNTNGWIFGVRLRYR